MQSGAIEKLYFSIGLIDKLSGPSKGVVKSIETIQSHTRTGILDVVKGGGAIGSMTFSLLKATSAARGFDKALGEVTSLDVTAQELDKLGAASNKFAMQFGGNAAEIVKSGYEIKSAIEGLQKNSLADFTYSGALLAKAGKADSVTTTKYMGTMFSIFEETANKIGQSKWVEELTGKTAHAVKIFKTTTGEMSAAFTNLGSIATQMGYDMNQQLAVLGMLQGTMGGSQAGTAFKAMASKMAQAQQYLGMSFKDTAGNMLPIPEIIDKISGKISHLDKDQRVAALSKAFGEEGAKAVLNLMGKTEKLRKSIGDISAIQDSSGAVKMAEAMTDPLDRLNSIGNVMGITFGRIILPGVNAVLNVLSSLGIGLIWLIDMFPPLRWGIGIVTAGIVALVIAWGIMKITMGAMGLWDALMLKIRLVNVSLWKMNVITGSMTKTQKLAAIANWVWQGSMSKVTAAAKFLRLNLLWNKTVMIASAVWTKVLGIAQVIMSVGFWGSATAVWGFTIALLACPLTWIVVGIMALVGGIIALIYYWDEVCAWVMKYSDYLMFLLGPLGLVIAAFKHWDTIKAYFQEAYNWLADKLSPAIEFVGSLFSWLSNLGSMVWSGIIEMFTGIDGWIGRIIRVLAKIPGLGFLDPEVNVNQSAKIERPVVPSVAASRKIDVPAGGIRNSSNVNNWGGVTINTTSPVGPGEMEDLWGLQA